MTAFELTVAFPGGGPLIGGTGASPHGFHAAHARLPDDRPYLPATALRGALREALEALLRGSGEHRACAGGDGTDPDTVAPARAGSDGAEARAATPARGGAASARAACSLGEAGAPCIACRLFGGRRAGVEAAARGFSGVVLGDAVIEGPRRHRWGARPSASLDRARRSVREDHLRFARVPEAEGGGPLVFVARGRLTDASLAPYLEAAVRATTHVGAGRSRGLAHVELALAWRHPVAPAPETPNRGTPELGADARIRVTLTSPALVGSPIVDAGYRETRHEIPGAAVRGAIGFALRERVERIDDDRAAQDLLDPERGARFGFLYPVGSEEASADEPAAPLPITTVACKSAGREHGLVDTLLDRLALLHASSALDAARALDTAVSSCPRCAAPFRGAPGSRRLAGAPATRAIVRVALDRARQSARDGQLYGQVLLAPGVTLEGTIRGIPAHSRARLVEAVTSGIISFGRGRSAGWGQARIELVPLPPPRPIAERAEAFDRALRARLERAGLDTRWIGRLIPVTLLSPLWPTDGDDGSAELCAALAPARCFLAARRFARDGAWDQRTGRMTTFLSTAAGGVFVLELEGASWGGVLARLEQLERAGIGQRRDQGYGRVLCFDAHFVHHCHSGER